MNLGASLRKAREDKGLTTSQLAARTHILVQIIEDMEREDFHRIPAAIYGRGFVRHWAEATGIDAAPLVNAFMAVYTGHRAPNEQMPPPVPAPEPQPVAAPEPPVQPSIFDIPANPEPPAPAPVQIPFPEEPVAEPEPVVAPEPIAEPEPVVAPEPVAEPEPVVAPEPVAEPEPVVQPPPEAVSEIPPAVRGLDLFDPQARPAAPRGVTPPTVESPFAAAYAEEPVRGPSATEKFRAGLSSVSHGVLGQVRRIPRNTWRIVLLAVAALAVVTLVILGCVKLYQITEKPVGTPPAAPVAAKPAPTAKPAPSAKPAPAKATKLVSTGDKVNPLYLD